MSELRSFVTICKKCEAAKRDSHTHVHVNWEKKVVAFICLDSMCENVEAFDKNWEPLLVRDKKESNKN